MPFTKEETALGETMAGGFLDEMEKIATFGYAEDGGVGTKEKLLGAQMQLERGYEVARDLGEPRSNKRAARLQRISNKIRHMEKHAAVSQVRYTKFFKHMMHERGITSPTQLTDAQKKKFFDRVDNAWKAKKETD